MNSNECEVDGIPGRGFKRMVITMIKEIKEDMDRHLNEFKVNTSIQLNKFKENK
jgi:hypothetical protein